MSRYHHEVHTRFDVGSRPRDLPKTENEEFANKKQTDNGKIQHSIRETDRQPQIVGESGGIMGRDRGTENDDSGTGREIRKSRPTKKPSSSAREHQLRSEDIGRHGILCGIPEGPRDAVYMDGDTQKV